MLRTNSPCAALAIGVATALASTAPAHAQTTASALAIRTLAASCAACHGTDGRAVEGAGNVPLRGLPRDYFVAQMTAFRDGRRPATVMQQIAKGYSPEQIEALAAFFAVPPGALRP